MPGRPIESACGCLLRVTCMAWVTATSSKHSALSSARSRWVGYLCLLEPNAKDAERGVQINNVAETFRPMTSVPIVVNTGFDKAKANAVLATGNADLVAFGVPYIANPDLVERFRMTHRSTSPIRPPSTASDPRATPITRRSLASAIAA